MLSPTIPKLSLRWIKKINTGTNRGAIIHIPIKTAKRLRIFNDFDFSVFDANVFFSTSLNDLK
jgi:hypothetical protein